MTFDQLEALFFDLDLDANPSGFHGFLCGTLSCGPLDTLTLREVLDHWLTLSPERISAAEASFQAFCSASLANLADPTFVFQPMLPNDDLPLPERLVAVGAWCGSYVSGVAERLQSDTDVSGDGAEALRDLTAIAQVSIDVDGDGERDYWELVEYVRIAVQLIFDELHVDEESSQPPTFH